MRNYVEFFFFFFNDTATTEIYTLSLHDALPILSFSPDGKRLSFTNTKENGIELWVADTATGQAKLDAVLLRSEEHTSELQSPCNLVCRLLLEKKKISSTPGCVTPCPVVAASVSV